MIQFNLLPNVKLEYVKAKRIKRITMLVAGAIAAASLCILIILFTVVQLQMKNSRDLSGDIKRESDKLQGTQDIASILTIQNQLKSLSTLHPLKPAAPRLLDYIQQTTPRGVTISNVDVDFETSTLTVQGEAASISQINTYVDTIKFTTFSVVNDEGSSDPVNAFKDVVLTSISTDPTTGTATYSLTFLYNTTQVYSGDDVLIDGQEVNVFSNSVKIKLTVPDKTTTRSEIDKPNSVFQPREGQE